ncbi:MerR family transcriptional regulator [Pendulispora albinea]|uniref:MerR family transcriptional regulator n=1 Tax=Pendulispora albinea TaxID=2741071 RepID=A0ABZ2LR56_9BACT
MMLTEAMPTVPKTDDTTSEEPKPEAPAYTIDELAAMTRVPSRTIRFYQSRGALMAPEIRGRVAYYGKAHVDRLKLIAQLQDRGLRVDAIRDFVKTIERGELDLAEWLGIERQMQAPWGHDQPRTVTESELYELAGTHRAGLIADLARARLVERRGDVYLLASPALLATAMKLEAVGIDLDTAAGASAILRKHLTRAVSDLVDFFVSRAKDGHLDVTNPDALFEAFRVTGIESVRLLFAREMEQALRKLLASGKVAALSARARKRKKT